MSDDYTLAPIAPIAEAVMGGEPARPRVFTDFASCNNVLRGLQEFNLPVGYKLVDPKRIDSGFVINMYYSPAQVELLLSNKITWLKAAD